LERIEEVLKKCGGQKVERYHELMKEHERRRVKRIQLQNEGVTGKPLEQACFKNYTPHDLFFRALENKDYD